jgi:cytochrome d ubiquinol oxidase subunit II
MLAYATAVILFTAFTVYALSGGADFGGGVWDLLARGPRAKAQREVIAHAIGPIWETNHVWMILVLVLLFTAFPRAFAAISVQLHIPITLALFGIVFRGSAFVFRSYDAPGGVYRRRWGYPFAVASIVTPLLLGVIVGAIAAGTIRLDPATGRALPDFFSAWLAPFPWAVGILTLTLFAFLAAVYLTLETRDPALQGDFRRRALAAGVALGACALAALLLAREGAPAVFDGLSRRWWSYPFHALTGACALAALAALWRRRYGSARLLAMAQAALIVWGWGLAQFPYVLAPNLTIESAAAPPVVLRVLLTVLGLGALVLVPSLGYLYLLFKGRRP